ncbi:MAG: hypothetical protein M3R02_28970 [Chloroflexota bacterium]|nr:hypothetical protein [Chloroflexota bacterium]
MADHGRTVPIGGHRIELRADPDPAGGWVARVAADAATMPGQCDEWFSYEEIAAHARSVPARGATPDEALDHLVTRLRVALAGTIRVRRTEDLAQRNEREDERQRRVRPPRER